MAAITAMETGGDRPEGLKELPPPANPPLPRGRARAASATPQDTLVPPAPSDDVMYSVEWTFLSIYPQNISAETAFSLKLVL